MLCTTQLQSLCRFHVGCPFYESPSVCPATSTHARLVYVGFSSLAPWPASAALQLVVVRKAIALHSRETV